MNSRISRLIKIAPALGVVAVLPLLAACNERAASAPAQLERPVQVQRVAFASEDAQRTFVGVVRARYETDLAFRVAGKMVVRVVNMGDRVHAGDVIARLDPQDFSLTQVGPNFFTRSFLGRFAARLFLIRGSGVVVRQGERKRHS